MACRWVRLAATVANAAGWEAWNTYTWVLAMANAQRQDSEPNASNPATQDLQNYTRRPRKSRIPSSNHSPAPCFNSLRFMRVPAIAVNATAGKLGPLGLSVGFQTRPSGLRLRDADTMGKCS
jgi:hypothetical protein